MTRVLIVYGTTDGHTAKIGARIAASAGGDTDTSRDYVYTDWAALRAFEDFAAGLRPGQTATPALLSARPRVA